MMGSIVWRNEMSNNKEFDLNWQPEQAPPKADIVDRLRDTPNWSKESWGDWKAKSSSYDRAPFEAANEIEGLRKLLCDIQAVVYSRHPESTTALLVYELVTNYERSHLADSRDAAN